ncbi:phage tail protein [Jejudonia soesokkakensis]|uniref:Phage tail protein n=1 Tax=Jejudonia soesokkakensis TaxID=1323432 RepID=A0ABW2MTK9_9FLAO
MEPLLGEIMLVGFNFAPRGWAMCEGQILSINQNQSLYSLLGTTYGGDGRTTFALPDLRSRVMVGVGNGPGLDSVTLGEKAGAITHTDTLAEMASHNHGGVLQISSEDGLQPSGNENYIASHPAAFHTAPTSGASLGGLATGNQGGNNQPYSIRNPYLGINHCIALTGLFPSRN